MIKIFSFLPEIILLMNIVTIEATHLLRQTQTPKTFATISKFFISFALVGCIVFYNVSYSEKWYVNSLYTTFFKSILLMCTLFLNFLACRYFVSKDYLSHRYYQTISFSLLSLCVAISSRQLGIYAIAVIFNQISIGKLSHLTNDNKKNEECLTINQWQIGILTILLIGAISWFYYTTNSLRYEEVIAFYNKTGLSFADKLSIVVLISVSLMMMGAAPFHIWFFQNMKYSSLPSASYIVMSSLIAGQGILLMFIRQNLALMAHEVSSILLLSGILSLLIGALGIGSCRHIRQTFFCVNLFNIGIVLILCSNLTPVSIKGCLIYSLVYGLSLLGLYTCCYGMKYRGEYLSLIDEVSGLSQDRGLLTAALTVLCVSLLGIPPLLGMLSNFTVFNILWQKQSWFLLFGIFTMFIVSAYGLLNLIKSVYFNPRKYHFDRIDKGVYVCLVCNITLIALMVLNPKYLMQDIETMIQDFLM